MYRLRSNNIACIEAKRKTATEYASRDAPLGSVFIKSFDLMGAVAKGGMSDQYLDYTVESLTCERELAMRLDANKNQKTRNVAYGLNEALGTMVTALIEKYGKNGVGQGLQNRAITQDCIAVVAEVAKVKTPLSDASPSVSEDVMMRVERPEVRSVRKAKDWNEVRTPKQTSRKRGEEVTSESREEEDESTGRRKSSRKRVSTRYHDESDYEESTPKKQKTISKHVCTICSLSCRSPGELATHMTTHTDERPFSCPDCDATFKVAYWLKDHQRKRHGFLPFACETCPARFTKRAELWDHMKAAGHRHRPKDHVCTVCSASFRSAGDLSAHEGTHTGVRPFACAHCDETFLRANKLYDHLRVAHDIAPFECLDCSKKFDLWHQLSKHCTASGHRKETAKELEKRYATA